MAKLLTVDVSALPTHEDRYKIYEMFEKSFDVNAKWFVLDPLHKTFHMFTAFWPYNDAPPIPSLPDCVKITVQ